MTATTAVPPVFLHPLADRNGSPAALLLDADTLAQSALLPTMVLRELAAGGMKCFYRAGVSDAVAQALSISRVKSSWIASSR